MEKRKRGASGFVVARGPAPPRLRRFEADSDPVRRRLAISRYLALSAAAPAGETGGDRRPLGREGGAAQTPLLHPDAAGQEDPAFEAEGLAGPWRRHQPHYVGL